MEVPCSSLSELEILIKIRTSCHFWCQQLLVPIPAISKPICQHIFIFTLPFADRQQPHQHHTFMHPLFCFVIMSQVKADCILFTKQCVVDHRADFQTPEVRPVLIWSKINTGGRQTSQCTSNRHHDGTFPLPVAAHHTCSRTSSVSFWWWTRSAIRATISVSW